MNKFFISLCTICLLTFSLFAQDKIKKSPEEKASAKTAEMVTALKLNKEQETMIYSTNLKVYQSIATYAAKNPDKKSKKKQKKIVQNLRDTEFKKILNAAQYKLYVENKKKEKAEEKMKEEKLKEELKNTKLESK